MAVDTVGCPTLPSNPNTQVGGTMVNPMKESNQNQDVSHHSDSDDGIEEHNSSVIDQRMREALMETVQDIRRFSIQGFPDKEKAEQSSAWLYTQGEYLICREVFQEPLFFESVLPIVVIFGEILDLDAARKDVTLLRSLTKAYRLFIELMWYQCWRDQEREPEKWPINEDLIQKILGTSKKYINSLVGKAVVDIRFDWQCIKQAANCLPSLRSPPVEFDRRLMFSQPNSKVKLDCVRKAFKCMMQSHGATVAAWYLDIHMLHWLAACVSSEEKFREFIEPEIDICRRKGGKYGVSLAMVLNRIIETSSDEALRYRALSGQGSHPGLVDLINWNHSKRKTMLSRKDPFEKVRLVTAQYLWKIAASQTEQYKELLAKSLRALESRYKTVQCKLDLEDTRKIESALGKLRRQSGNIEDENVVQSMLAMAR